MNRNKKPEVVRKGGVEYRRRTDGSYQSDGGSTLNASEIASMFSTGSGDTHCTTPSHSSGSCDGGGGDGGGGGGGD
jgi:hypothetical protein